MIIRDDDPEICSFFRILNRRNAVTMTMTATNGETEFSISGSIE